MQPEEFTKTIGNNAGAYCRLRQKWAKIRDWNQICWMLSEWNEVESAK